MRKLLLLLLLVPASGFAQSPAVIAGPDFSRAARPRGSFYLNGIGHQYLKGTNYTVVAAAIPVLNAKFLGVKIHVINQGAKSVDVLPDEVTAEDSVSSKELELYPSGKVNEKMQRPSTMSRLAGVAGGAPMGGPGGEGTPSMTDLVRELMQQAAAENPWAVENGYPTLPPADRRPRPLAVRPSATWVVSCAIARSAMGMVRSCSVAKPSLNR